MSKSIEVNGFCNPAFFPIQEAFVRNFENDLELGASVAIMVGDDLAVDLWAGYSDRKKTKPWAEDTIVQVFSTTKVMTMLSVLLLIDRGQLDINTPIAKYWPEFAQQGKENMLVCHVLNHSSGLPAWDEVHPFESLFDWDKMVGLLAAQTPWWTPGEKCGYHPHTFGFLLGELVRRISGITIGNFFKQEIAEKIGADLHIGLSEEQAPRVAQIYFSGVLDYAAEDLGPLAFRVGTNIEPGNIETKAAREAELPSTNGYGNARSLALLGALIANCGEVKGKRLLDRQTVEMVFEEQSYRKDLVFGQPVRFGLGLGLNSNEFPFPNPNTCYWGGHGGSFCIMDADSRTCIAYAMNNALPGVMIDPRGIELMDAFRKVIREM